MNQVVLTGRLVRDPDLQDIYGQKMARFTIAVRRNYKNSNGEYDTDFISCTVWRKTAEFLEKYFTKGTGIEITGSIHTGSYEKDGIKKYVFEVIGDRIGFWESNKSNTDVQDYKTKNNSNDSLFGSSYKSSWLEDAELPF